MKTITNNEYYNLSYEEREKFVGIVKDHNGAIFYYKDGYFHREDGPAKIWPDGREEYWINCKRIESKEAFELLRDMMKLKGINI